MNYEYNVKLFNTVQQNYINKAIAIADEKYKEILDIMTSVNNEGKPIFDEDLLKQIYSGITQGMGISDIKFFTKLNANMEPIYNTTQMNEIRIGFHSKMTLDEIFLFARLNKNDQPVFSGSQMTIINYFLKNENFPKDAMSICLKTVDDVPVFNSDQMFVINSYIRDEANPKEIQQLKGCVNDGLKYEQIEFMIKKKISADSIRIYRSFYDIGCTTEIVNHIGNQGFNYDELKEIKRIFKYTKELANLNSKLTPEGYYTIIPEDNFSVEDLTDKFAEMFHLAYGFSNPECRFPRKDLIFKCFQKDIEPEKIDFLITSGYTKEEVWHVLDLLLDGADFNKIKELREEAVNILSIDEMPVSFSTEDLKDKEL